MQLLITRIKTLFSSYLNSQFIGYDFQNKMSLLQQNDINELKAELNELNKLKQQEAVCFVAFLFAIKNR